MICAHSTSTTDRSDWETLFAHSGAVARAARENAGIFAPELGEITGWLHDLGKMKPRFQRRLSDPSVVEPHSAEGARHICERQPHPLSAVLAQVILGHHAGLPDGGGTGRLLRARLEEAEKLDPPEDWPVPRITTAPRPMAGMKSKDPHLNYALAFLGRMVFSALVDADRSETRAFYDRIEKRGEPAAEPVDLTVLRDRLDAHMARQKRDGPVNDLRRHVHSHARAQAENSPGLFSLTVPTGGGKTLTALGFALDHAIRHGLKRVIFVIPYTSVVEQTAEVFREVLDDPEGRLVLEHHSAFDWEDVRGDDELASLRTAAERWDRPVIVTTAVQFLESLHAARPARCRKLHRLAEAVVILDEAQTLPRHLLRPSLAAIKELARGYRSSVVFCTATQPALLKNDRDGFPHPEGLDAEGPWALRELAPDPRHLYESLRRVRVEFVGRLDNAALAAELAAPSGGLAILNNRRHARALYEAIRDLPGACHLSTNMTARHRRAVLGRVRARLEAGEPVRLVSTSLIEAGVDISFPVVFRALAGVDSIAQAAGRCNRNAELTGLGRVVVFDPEPGDNNEFAPPPELRQLADAARQVLLRHPADPLSLDAVRDYFRQVYWNGAHAMDAGKVEGKVFEILSAIAAAGSQGMPYDSIARAFQMIPEGAQPVVMLGGDWGLPEDERDELEFIASAGAIARRLQSYQVQVPDRSRRKMLAAGVLTPLRPAEFGEQFLLLNQPALYDPQTGLRWDDYGDLGFLSF